MTSTTWSSVTSTTWPSDIGLKGPCCTLNASTFEQYQPPETNKPVLTNFAFAITVHACSLFWNLWDKIFFSVQQLNMSAIRKKVLHYIITCRDLSPLHKIFEIHDILTLHFEIG